MNATCVVDEHLKLNAEHFKMIHTLISITGLEALHEMTHLRRYKLRVEITTGDNVTYFSEYDQIRVASEAKQFR